MTRERALELAQYKFASSLLDQPITETMADAILAAVAEERESCAKVGPALALTEPTVCFGCADSIAAAIRERGIPLKVGA